MMALVEFARQGLTEVRRNAPFSLRSVCGLHNYACRRDIIGLLAPSTVPTSAKCQRSARAKPTARLERSTRLRSDQPPAAS